MERKTYLIIALLIAFTTSIMAQKDYKSAIYNAYISNKMDTWKRIIDEMERDEQHNHALTLELINYQYGYVGYCIGLKRSDEAKLYLGKLEANVEKLKKKKEKLSHINAYKASIYGFKIGLAPIRAPFEGPSSISAAKEALKLDAKNPLAHLAYGNTQFYMPEAFGGSKKLAISHYLQAQKLMEQHPATITNDWNYLSLLVTMAKAYEKIGQKTTAKAYYEKILALEPNFRWVRDELYPAILKETTKP
jgi:tetratricopeptide (TPR) repeat protein